MGKKLASKKQKTPIDLPASNNVKRFMIIQYIHTTNASKFIDAI